MGLQSAIRAWRRRRYELAVKQLEAGRTGEQRMLDSSHPHVSGAAFDEQRNFWNSFTKATTRTEWRGD